MYIGTNAERTRGGEAIIHRRHDVFEMMLLEKKTRGERTGITHTRTHSLVVVVLVQILLEPIHILEEVFHAVHQSAVRAEFQLDHDVVDGYQIPDVERHLVSEVFGGRVEIRDVYPATVLRSHREAVLFVRLFGCSVVRCCVHRFIYIIHRSIGLARVASGECEAARTATAIVG